MKLLRHLIAADLKRHRLLLAVWLLVVASKAIIDGVQPTLAGDAALSRIVGLLGFVLGMAELLLMIVLVPLLVHTHPLVGSDAFWMTRPIPPQTLLTGKALFLAAAVVGVPIVAEAVLMGAYQVPPPRVVAVAAESALFRTFWLVLLMTAAALTPNMPRFALFCGGVLVALAVVLATMTAILLARFDQSPPRSSGVGSEDPTSGIVLLVLVVVAAVALLIVQYRTRSRLRSVLVGGMGLLLAFLVASAWPWPILAPKLDPPAWAADKSAVRLGAGAESVQVKEMPSFSRRSSWMLAQARVWAAGIEPRWSAQVGVLEATLQLDGSNRLVSTGSSFPTAVSVDPHEPHPTRGVMRRLLGVQRLVDPGAPHTDSTTVFFVRDAELQRLAPASGTYVGRFQVRLTRHDLEATLPLHRDATHQNGAYRLVIASVERSSGGVSIVARESDATSMFDRRAAPQFSFYLRNQEAGVAVEGSYHDLGDELFLSGFLPFFFDRDRNSGFRVRSLLIRFPPSPGVEGETFPIADGWLEGAELVVVRLTPEGSVERTLTIAGFPLRPESGPAAEK